MLGLLLLYFIWKYYSELAIEYDKSKWGWAILGIASYYGGAFIGGMILGVIQLLTGTSFLDDSSKIVLNLLGLPFGILTVWGLYKFLEYKWSHKERVVSNEVLDMDLIENR